MKPLLINLSPGDAEALEAVRHRLGLRTKADTIRAAIRIAQWWIDTGSREEAAEESSGRKRR